jgi:hypothetical protein
MGHYCRICGRQRPNERFSGKGHKIHVCKRCQAKPKTERRAIEDQDDIFRRIANGHSIAANTACFEFPIGGRTGRGHAQSVGCRSISFCDSSMTRLELEHGGCVQSKQHMPQGARSPRRRRGPRC